MSSTNPFRLPKNVVPSRYELVLEPDLDASRFVGSESISIEIHEPTREIILNAIELEVFAAWVERKGAERVDASIDFDSDAEIVTLSFEAPLDPGSATLHITFAGTLNDKLHGWYRSSYTDAGGEPHTIAVTQFESTAARRAFPCWDEPEFKAVFGVTLVVANGLLAVANGAELGQDLGADGRRTFRFADSMHMSTYLVAFVVGELEATAPVMVAGIPVRIVHQPGKSHLAGFALDTAKFGIPALADYFGSPYPSEKCDLVAVPDFAFGAMENQGCITFRETLLLVNPDAVTKDELQNVAAVINHELAHSWFGNLVTMRWWEGIWLNEAFATFIETTSTDWFKPEWKVWDSFARDRSMAFDVDSLATSRAIEFPVASPADCEGMFDVLTYEKGGSVLRMLEQYLGVEVFRDGIRHYLRTHAYGNTETTDLWDRIEESSGKPVRRIMDSWIYQPGYPIIDARLDGTTLTLDQRVFRYATGDEPSPQTWAVPIVVRTLAADGTATIDKVLLDTDSTTLTLGDPTALVVVNAGANGFFRVRYDASLQSRILARLADLSPAERYALVDDAWAAVLADSLPIDQFMRIAESFGGDHPETQVPVWQTLNGALGEIRRLLPPADRPAFATWVARFVVPALNSLGADADPELKAVLFRASGDLAGDPAVIGTARALFASSGPVEPNLLAAATSITALNGSAADYAELVRRWRTAATPQEETRYLYALPTFPGQAEVDNVLHMAISGEIRSQNSPFILQLALRNLNHGERAWAQIRQAWPTLNDNLPSNLVVRILAGLRVISDPRLAADALAFCVEHPLPQASKQVDQVLERVRVNVALRERASASLHSALVKGE